MPIEHSSGADGLDYLERTSDPRTVAWTEHQNAVSCTALESLFGEARELALSAPAQFDHLTLLSVAASDPARLFVTSRRPGTPSDVLWSVRARGEQVDAAVLLDLGRSGTARRFRWIEPTGDGRFIGLGVQQRAGSTVTLLLDAERCKLLRPPLELAESSAFCWLDGGERFLYSIPEVDRPAEVRLWVEQREPSVEQPRCIDGASAALRGATNTHLHVSPDGHRLVAAVTYERASSAVFVCDMRTTPWTFARVFSSASPSVLCAITPSTAFVHHAERGGSAVSAFDLETPKAEAARTVVLADDELVVDMCATVGGVLLATLRRGAARLARIDESGTMHELFAPPLSTITAIAGSPAWDDAAMLCESFTSPPAIVRVSVSGARHVPLWPRRNDANDPVAVESDAFPSLDGTSVPIVVVRPGVRDRRRTCVVVQAYGGFGVHSSPRYDPGVVAWVRRGGIYVFVHVRGGGEIGEDWRRAGARLSKKTSIDDLTAALRHVADWDVIDRSRIGVIGESHGGLLAASIAVTCGALVRAVVLVSPLTDMLRFHRFGAGAAWSSEFGSPDDDRTSEYLRSYSPYHNVRDGGPVPATLVLVSGADAVVDAMHARKFVARLQRAVPAATVLFRSYEALRSHAESSLRERDPAVLADVWSFLFSQLALDGER